MPVDGDANVIVRFTDDSQSMDFDRGPVKENKKDFETSSFIPEKLNQPLEETTLEQSLEYNVQWKNMDVCSVPFNKFSAHYHFRRCFHRDKETQPVIKKSVI